MNPRSRLPAVGVVAVAALLLAGDARSLLTFADPEIAESSGLVDLGDALLTANDSGSAAVVHLVDKRSGETIGRTAYAEEVVDVEALAAGPDGSVWVGDIGDNAARRMSVTVHRLDPVRPGDRTVTSTRYELGYLGGPRDAEALLVHPRSGRLFVVSKGLLGGEVYAAPARLSADELNVLRPVGEAGALVTDGAFLPDGRHAVLRSYTAARLHDADTWEPVGFATLPRQRQGEGLAVASDGEELLLSSEGRHSEVLVVPVPTVPEAASRAPGVPTPDRASGQQPEGDGATWLLVAGGVLAGGLAAALALAVRAARRRGRWRR